MRLTVSVIIVLCVFTSCRDRVVCPAYQSTYILDDSVRQTYYSYLWKLDEAERQKFLAQEKAKDSIPDQVSYTPSAEYFAYVEPYVPPIEKVEKNKFGIIKYKPFWIKNASLRTAPKVNVRKPIIEKEFTQEGDFVASEFTKTDSLGNAGDTTKVTIPLALRRDSLETKEETKFLYGYRIDDNFNMEQVYYNKYYRKLFIDNRPKPKPDTTLAGLPTLAIDSLDSAGGKKGVKGFFKGLFNKKKKSKKPKEEEEEKLPEEGILPEEEESTQEGF